MMEKQARMEAERQMAKDYLAGLDLMFMGLGGDRKEEIVLKANAASRMMSLDTETNGPIVELTFDKVAELKDDYDRRHSSSEVRSSIIVSKFGEEVSRMKNAIRVKYGIENEPNEARFKATVDDGLRAEQEIFGATGNLFVFKLENGTK